jgi:hypothetical protein
MTNITDTLVAIDKLHADATRIVAQLDEIIAAEPTHERRGLQSRLRQMLLDLLVHGIGQARQPAVDKIARIKRGSTRAAAT